MTELSTRAVAEGFIQMGIRERRVAEALQTYIDPVKYIQHNPTTLDGRDNAVKLVTGLVANCPDYSIEVKRLLVDGDLFCVHLHMKLHAGDSGLAIADLFRVEKGKIVEHWDVAQPVPTDSINPKAMF